MIQPQIVKRLIVLFLIVLRLSHYLPANFSWRTVVLLLSIVLLPAFYCCYKVTMISFERFPSHSHYTLYSLPLLIFLSISLNSFGFTSYFSDSPFLQVSLILNPSFQVVKKVFSPSLSMITSAL